MQHRLIWFRDDLRITDNAAVVAAFDCGPQVRISAVFLSADHEWESFGYGANRLYYTEQLLRNLSVQLSQNGISLQVIRLNNYLDQVVWLTTFCQIEGVTDLYFNQEYQLNERIRDHSLTDQIYPSRVHSFVDRVLLQPGGVMTADNRFYSVFSPFKKRWLSRIQDGQRYMPFHMNKIERPVIPRLDWQPLCLAPESDLSEFETTEAGALGALEQFTEKKLAQYDDKRNSPAQNGTSRLSAYLARGLISPRQCIAATESQLNRPLWDLPDGAFSWINELIWRDFYQHLLIGFPKLSKSKAFRPETEALKWRNVPDEIEAWRAGQTGIPIVDAGIRELKTKGWMHNRVRMIVAQFFTKNLLCDWRIGEAYFMRYLVDSDLGSNNGGWQWSASTGTDAAPYFRVFNPVSQSEAHDPEGSYLTRYIPELASLPSKKRHAPWLTCLPKNYPAPIVDLKSSRQRAIDAFKNLKS